MSITAEKMKNKYEIDFAYRFVPYSSSRFYNPKANILGRTLNWEVSLLYQGLEMQKFDYTAGLAHIPGWKNSWHSFISVDDAEYINHCLEMGTYYKIKWNKIEPEYLDVLYSLTSDMDVLNYRGFEDWAESFGCDTDSIKAYKTYEFCLKLALNLRYELGDELFKELISDFQNY